MTQTPVEEPGPQIGLIWSKAGRTGAKLGTGASRDCRTRYVPKPSFGGLRHEGLDEPQGDFWDSAVTETLFGSLKVERLHDMRHSTWLRTKDEIMDWLTFYNGKRLHSMPGYISPLAFVA